MSKKKAVSKIVAFFLMATLLGVLACERESLDLDAVQASAEGAQPEGAVRGDQYRTRTTGENLAVLEEGAVAFQILPGPDLKINLEFPWRIEFEAPEGVDLQSRIFDTETISLDEDVAELALHVKATTPGRHEISGVANFSVCNDDRCDILQREPVKIVVYAQE